MNKTLRVVRVPGGAPLYDIYLGREKIKSAVNIKEVIKVVTVLEKEDADE